MKPRSLLVILLFATLVVGTGIGLRDPAVLLWSATFYGLALGLRLLVGVSEEYFQSTDKNRFAAPAPEVVLAGKELPLVDEGDQREERFLRNFELKTVAKRRLSELIYLGFAAFVIFYRMDLEDSLPGVLPAITGYLILASTYVGHLYVPLALNVWSAGAAFTDAPPSPATVPVYVFLVFATFRQVSELSGTQLRWSRFRHVLGPAILFTAMLFGFYRLLPNPSEEERKAKELTEKTREVLGEKRKVARAQLAALEMFSLPEAFELRGELAKHEASLGNLERTLSSDAFTPEAAPTLRHELRELEERERELRELEERERELEAAVRDVTTAGAYRKMDPSEVLAQLGQRTSNRIEATANDLAARMEANQERIRELRSGTAPVSSGSDGLLEELEAKAQALKDEFEKTVNLSPGERGALESYVGDRKEELAQLERIHPENPAIKEQRRALEELEALAGKPNPSTGELRELGEALRKTQEVEALKARLRSDAPTGPVAANFPVLDEGASPPRERRNRWVPLLLLLACFALVIYLVNRRGIRKIEVEDRELQEVTAALRKLRALRLSPRDEVIHFYNLLHDLLQKVHYLPKETPPSCIVNADLPDIHPKLARATFVVTETFARCFYGGEDVSPRDLSAFRKALRSLLVVYGLRP